MPSRSVRGWRRRRALVWVTIVSVGAGAGIASFTHRSDANGPVVNGYEQPTLADTAYSIPAGALFVSLSGSDSNPGTQAAPFATVSKALTIAPNGATIVLRGGTYRESLMMKKSVTLQAYPHEQPWVVGSDPVTGFAPSGSAWARSWTSSLCHSCYSTQVIDPAYPAAGLPDQVFFDGTPLAQVPARSALGRGKFYYDGSQHLLYLGSDPTGHAVEVTARATVLLITSAATGAAVKGIGFAHAGATYDSSAGAMVQNSAPNARFDRDTFAWSASRGLNVYAANTVVTNSLMLYSGSNGFHAHLANGLVFQNNRVAYSNAEHFSITPSPYASEGGAKITHSWNTVFTGNVFDGNGANGLWFDVACTNTVIANNSIVRSAGHGLAYEVSGNATIAGNLIADNAREGMKISGVSHAEIWNNTVVGNGWSQLAVYEDPRHDNNPVDNAAGITFDTANVHVGNNAFVADSGATRAVFESFDISSPKHLTTGQMMPADHHNVWSRQTAITPSVLLNWSSTLTSMSRFSTLATAQSGTGREAASIAADNAPLSALFTDAAHDNYSPALGSPLRQAGGTLPSAVAAAMGVNATNVKRGAPHPPAIGGTGGGTPTTTTTVPVTTTVPSSTTTAPPSTTTTTPAGLPALSIDNVSVTAPATGTDTKLTFTITLSQAAASSVSVDYSTTDGTAVAVRDYDARAGSATFLPGVLTRHIVVTVHGNATSGTRTFFANLSAVVGATITSGHGTATIN
jgi:poly(beta-D-mannuronate) C5 epimerase